MQVTHSQEGSITILHLEGKFNANAVSSVKKKVNQLIAENHVLLVFDYSRVDFVDSSGLGCMLSCFNLLKSKNGNLKVAGMSVKVRSVFELIQMHKMFESFETAADAVQGY